MRLFQTCVSMNLILSLSKDEVRRRQFQNANRFIPPSTWITSPVM